MRVHFQSKPWLHPSKPGHPERPQRLMAAYAGLSHLPAGALSWAPIAPIDLADAAIAHDQDYLDMLAEESFPHGGARVLDGGDTVQSATSLEAALSALGGARAGINEIMSGRTQAALMLARPAGHHATRSEAMGFCLLGAAGWAALEARRAHGARVAVLDFDLHHGNGTQDILWDAEDIFFASSHELHNYPGTGLPGETGAHDNVLNVPLEKGTGSAEMRQAWEVIFTRVADFAPDLIIVSAGFDAHGDDPLSGLDWSLDDYHWLGESLAELADQVCGGRVLSILEGGYDLQVLRHALPAYIAPLCELDAPEAPSEAPSLDLGGWMAPHLGGATRMPSAGNPRFDVRKVNQRLWIEESTTGQFLWTPPDFIRLQSRREMMAICAEANAQDGLHIDQLIAIEAQARRPFGYNPGRSQDFGESPGLG